MLKSKNVEISDTLRDYINKKLDRLGRHLDRIIETKVELAREHTRSQDDRYTAQITISANHTILRTEERGEELRAVVDLAIDSMDRKIDRYKTRLSRRNKRTGTGITSAEVVEIEAGPAPELEEGEPGAELTRVARHKRFSIEPMFPEEAAEQMELLGHGFFVFYNASSEQVCVIYRRKDGTYGLLEPELG